LCSGQEYWDYDRILTEQKKLSTQNTKSGLQLHFDKTAGNIDNAVVKDALNKDFYAAINSR
jgi:hypothetical protein